MRLQKYLADSGVASRRHAEEMIVAGRVSVNGQVMTELGTQVSEGDQVAVDGRTVSPPSEYCYIMYHKPAGEVTTVSDPEGRRTVMQHFDRLGVRLYPVGRLDYDSEGLLLLTNDGELTNRLLHPRREVDKTYVARVSGTPTLEQVKALRDGVVLDDRRTSRAKIRVTRQEEEYTYVTVTIHEGRNRQVRRMFEAVGLHVTALKRVGFGPLTLGNLRRGEWRYLTAEEIALLRSQDA